MEKTLTGFSWGKYLGTDIDTILLHFDQTKEKNLVDEFEVPENEKHMVFYSKTEDEKKLAWIEIVNPQSVYEQEKATLPEITVKIKNRKYALKEIIDLLVKLEYGGDNGKG